MNLGGTVHINKKGFVALLCLSLLLIYYLASSKGTHEESSQVNLRQLLAVAIKAAEDGGMQVVDNRDHLIIESKGKTKEGANDSVTTADLKSHCVMIHTLRSVFPMLRIISEESNTVCPQDNSRTSEVVDSNLPDEFVHGDDITVWIDPLDATQEYTEKLYEYVTTMVCVAVHGKPIIGVIHKPFAKSTSWAWHGKGSSFNSLKPQVNADTIKFIVSRSHMGKVKEFLSETYKNEKIDITPAGGAGYKVLEVVNGNADAYVHLTAIKKWDICAGNAILNALGGTMVTKDKAVIDYTDSQNPVNENGLIATLNNDGIYVKVTRMVGVNLVKALKNSIRTKLSKISSVVFSRYLFVTNVGISCTLSGLGDILEQQYEITNKKIGEWDIKRTRKMALTGLPVGVVVHCYYTFLDKKLPGRNFKTLVKKLLFDQLVNSPMCICTFLLTVACLENTTVQEFQQTLKSKLWRLYVAEWVVWPPAQIINFYFLPPKYRVLYDNVISLGYDIYTSYVNHDDYDTDD